MLTKQEALRMLTKEHEEQDLALSMLVDSKLAVFDGDRVSVCLAGKGYSRKVIQALAERYRLDGGWTVEILSGDQRDPGPFLIFS